MADDKGGAGGFLPKALTVGAVAFGLWAMANSKDARTLQREFREAAEAKGEIPKSKRASGPCAPFERHPRVRTWLRKNPPPSGWRGTRAEWAWTEMPFAPRVNCDAGLGAVFSRETKRAVPAKALACLSRVEAAVIQNTKAGQCSKAEARVDAMLIECLNERETWPKTVAAADEIWRLTESVKDAAKGCR